MSKLTMHQQILALLIAETSEKKPTVQPIITKKLRFSKKHGSRALVLNELQERNPSVHKRVIRPDERKPEHGRARFFWWYDDQKVNDVFGKPKHPKVTEQPKLVGECIREDMVDEEALLLGAEAVGMVEADRRREAGIKFDFVYRLKSGAVVPATKVDETLAELEFIRAGHERVKALADA